MSINEKAMLVYLNISFWTARKYDKRISQEIEDQYNADDAGRYNKILIAKEHLANIQKIISAARTFHYENTLPWNDNGGRLLPSANYFNYVKSIQGLKDDFQQEVNNFLRVYPDLKDEAKGRLNGMFDEEDYPEENLLEDKFAFRKQGCCSNPILYKVYVPDRMEPYERMDSEFPIAIDSKGLTGFWQDWIEIRISALNYANLTIPAGSYSSTIRIELVPKN